MISALLMLSFSQVSVPMMMMIGSQESMRASRSFPFFLALWKLMFKILRYCFYLVDLSFLVVVDLGEEVMPISESDGLEDSNDCADDSSSIDARDPGDVMSEGMDDK